MADNSLYTHCEKYLAPEGIYLSVKPQPNKWSDAPKLGRLAFDVIVPGCYGGVNRKFAYVCTIFLNPGEVFIALMLQYGRGQAQERRPGRYGRYVGEVYVAPSSVVVNKANAIPLFRQPE